MTRFGFIGTGSMGSMLIRKFISSGLVAAADIAAHSATGKTSRDLSGETGIIAAQSNIAAVENADVVFLCVRPLQVHGVVREIRDVLAGETLLVSIAGCVTLANLSEWTQGKARCARIIPSVTAEQESGISLVAWGPGVGQEDKDLILRLLNAFGTAIETEESNFELYADLTSCAPALIAAMMREFAAAAARRGTIQPGLAEYLVRETMIGTARLLARDSVRFGDVIERVATKGGITEEGVKVLQARLPGVFDELLDATIAKHEIVRGKVKEEAREDGG